MAVSSRHIDAETVKAALLANDCCRRKAAAQLGITPPVLDGITKRAGIKIVELKYVGRRFGRQVIISLIPGQTLGGRREMRALVRCDCGTERVVSVPQVARGCSTSCGCYHSERMRARVKHGRVHSPEWSSWQAMKVRCYRPAAKAYTYYGALGVRVCERWRNSFETFLSDMGERPTPTYTLDRINPFGNYEPENCRWATPQEQAANRRKAYLRRESAR